MAIILPELMSERSGGGVATQSRPSSPTEASPRGDDAGKVDLHPRVPTRLARRARRSGTKTAIAQIRYQGDGTWNLYFGDRYGK